MKLIEVVPPMNFSLNTSHIGTTTILHIHGRLDSLNIATLQEQLNALLERYGAQDLILNMEDVNYLSAAGLRLLHNLHDRTGQVRIASPSPRVVEVLQITGLNQLYSLYSSQTAAIHQVRPVTNAHTSLEQGWMHHHRPSITGMDTLTWLNEHVLKSQSLIHDEHDPRLMQAIDKGIQDLIDRGTTVIADISTSGLSLAPLMASGLRGIVYLELAEANPERVNARFARAQTLITDWRPRERGGGIRIGLSLHAPYAFHPDQWTRIIEYARKESLPLSIGVAQTAAEREFFISGTGPFVEQNPYKAVFSEDCVPHKSPIAYLQDTGALALKPLLVHAIQVDEEDIKRIKDSGARIVHCPRSELCLRKGRMPLEKYLAQNIPVLLATDSLASASSLNVFDELDVAHALHYQVVSPDQIQNMIHNALIPIAETSA
jgi:anti-anti-sigma factor